MGMIGAGDVVPPAGFGAEGSAPPHLPNVFDRRNLESPNGIRRDVGRGDRLDDQVIGADQEAAAFARLLRARMRCDGVERGCQDANEGLRRQPR